MAYAGELMSVEETNTKLIVHTYVHELSILAISVVGREWHHTNKNQHHCLPIHKYDIKHFRGNTRDRLHTVTSRWDACGLIAQLLQHVTCNFPGKIGTKTRHTVSNTPHKEPPKKGIYLFDRKCSSLPTQYWVINDQNAAVSRDGDGAAKFRGVLVNVQHGLLCLKK